MLQDKLFQSVSAFARLRRGEENMLQNFTLTEPDVSPFKANFLLSLTTEKQSVVGGTHICRNQKMEMLIILLGSSNLKDSDGKKGVQSCTVIRLIKYKIYGTHSSLLFVQVFLSVVRNTSFPRPEREREKKIDPHSVVQRNHFSENEKC